MECGDSKRTLKRRSGRFEARCIRESEVASNSRGHRISWHRGHGSGYFRSRAIQQVVKAARFADLAPAQARRQTGRGQGLKTLQREATLITAGRTEMPCSQAKWSWDCLTPHKALTGRSVSASAYAFVQNFFSTRMSFGSIFHRVTTSVPRHAIPPRRGVHGRRANLAGTD